MEALNNVFLTDMEKDVIGEVMNISLGSSATSLSSLLSKRVDITVPKVNVVSMQNFDFQDLEPAVGVEIKYIEGITGDNVLILKKVDIKVILETLMGVEIADEEFELDEIAMSAVCEVMNQMMGSSATALADFLGRTVNISTPIAYEIIDKADFKGRYFSETDNLVEVKFDLKVGEVINSEFINVLSIPLAKEMVKLFLAGTGLGEDDISAGDEILEVLNNEKEKEILQKPVEKKETPIVRKEESAQSNNKPEKSKAKPIEKYDFEDEDEDDEEPVVSQRKSKKRRYQDYNEDEYEYDDEDYEYEARPRRPVERKPKRNRAPVNVSPMQYESFDDEDENLSEDQRANLGLIMSVPLQVSVEIGRTKKRIKDILEFSQGTIVELDKQAGSQVDIIINGQVIAKGDVVVVNDNFGVRVTEIVKKDEIVKLTM